MKRLPVSALVLTLLLALVYPLTAQARMHSLFYMLPSRTSIESFEAHKNQISILVPAWYSVDAQGLVAGDTDPAVLRDAKAAHIPVIPLVGLANKAALHKLFYDAKAQAAMNAALVRDCKQYGYAGFQIDFEDVSWTDRDALSALVKNTAGILHQNGLQLEIATVPNAPGYPGGTAFPAGCTKTGAVRMT